MGGELQRLLEVRRILILDGAMGTELQRRGADVSLPLWSARSLLTDPGTVLQIHRDYIEAGADILTTNTFRTTRRTFSRANLPDRSLELTAHAVGLAREAREHAGKRKILLAGSVAPLEDCYAPELVPPDHELRVEHAEHCYRLVASGVDFLLLETMGTVREAFAACEAARRTGADVVVSFLCRSDGALYGGESLEEAVAAIEPLGVQGFSLNCISPREMGKSLRRLRALTDLPLMAYGNVGRPGEEHRTELFCDVLPAEYAQIAARWVELGASVIGGCCGTGPEYIRRLNEERTRITGEEA